MKIPLVIQRLSFVIVFCCMAGATIALLEGLEELTAPRAFLKTLPFFSKTSEPESHAPEALFDGQTIQRTILGLIDALTPGDGVYITTFILTDETIYHALLTAHRKGVSIMLIADGEYAFKGKSKIPLLIKAGIPVYIYAQPQVNPNDRPGIMHNKFIIFESQERPIVVTGSYNLTQSAANKNQENLVLIDHPHTIKDFKEHFLKLQHASKRAIKTSGQRG